MPIRVLSLVHAEIGHLSKTLKHSQVTRPAIVRSLDLRKIRIYTWYHAAQAMALDLSPCPEDGSSGQGLGAIYRDRCYSWSLRELKHPLQFRGMLTPSWPLRFRRATYSIMLGG